MLASFRLNINIVLSNIALCNFAVFGLAYSRQLAYKL